MPEYRFKYTKLGKVRFLGHRDLARCWERGLRQAGVPLAFSQGFTPHPKVAFGLALATGVESDAEYIDVETTAPVAAGVKQKLDAALPDGIDVLDMVEIDGRATSLMAATAAVRYAVFVHGPDAGMLREAAERVLAAPSLTVVVRRKAGSRDEDIRPAVLEAATATRDGQPVLEVLLSTRPQPVRPGEIVAAAVACGIPLRERLSRRVAQFLDQDGVLVDPLHADRVAVRH